MMLQRFLACTVATLACLAASTAALRAETIISQPDAAYIAGTTLINISGAAFPVNSVAGGGVTVTFTAGGLTPFQVPIGWGTWSSPPFSETATPFVVAAFGPESLTLNLSGTAVKAFGFELETANFGLVNVTANFSTGDIISQMVNGNSGAQLFALTGPGVITSVTISAPGSGGMALGQFRFSPNDISAGPVGSVPEPASLAAWGFIAGVACVATRLRRRMGKAA